MMHWDIQIVGSGSGRLPVDEVGPYRHSERRRRASRSFVFVIASWLLSPTVATAVAEDRAIDSGVRRPADSRPHHDDAKLRSLGIQRYESPRLVLYSDIAPAVAKTLPPLIDAAYTAWTDYFGPLPPAEDGSEFQLTGYLMKDRGLFLDSRLLPEDLVDFQHGKHRGYEFWMAEQPYDYYRRHLLLHEATHCFMTIVPSRSSPPLFYQEGMAELFGTHTIDKDGRIALRQMPTDPLVQVGFGRIEILQQEVAAGRGKSFDAVLRLSANDFTSRSIPYAWSWAACQFLETHPLYRERFHQISRLTDGDEFRNELAKLFASDRDWLENEWQLFIHSIAYGYDIERAAIDKPAEVRALRNSERVAFEVAANRGWQCVGIEVRKGDRITLAATGEVTLANEPKPWVSHPQGITIRYANGQPLGRLMVSVLPDDPAEALTTTDYHGSPIGREATIVAPCRGQLAVRVNDAWDQLADNQGAFQVTVQSASR